VRFWSALAWQRFGLRRQQRHPWDNSDDILVVADLQRCRDEPSAKALPGQRTPKGR